MRFRSMSHLFIFLITILIFSAPWVALAQQNLRYLRKGNPRENTTPTQRLTSGISADIGGLYNNSYNYGPDDAPFARIGVSGTLGVGYTSYDYGPYITPTARISFYASNSSVAYAELSYLYFSPDDEDKFFIPSLQYRMLPAQNSNFYLKGSLGYRFHREVSYGYIDYYNRDDMEEYSWYTHTFIISFGIGYKVYKHLGVELTPTYFRLGEYGTLWGLGLTLDIPIH